MFCRKVCFTKKDVLSKSLFHRQKVCFVEKFVSSKSLFHWKVSFAFKSFFRWKVCFVEKFVFSKKTFLINFRQMVIFHVFFWQEPMQIFTLKSNTLEFQRSDENQVSYCHFSSFKAPSITEPRTKCARCETPLIQHFFKNFWSSFNAEFYPESKSVRISKIRQILTNLRIFFIHILRTYICREETNFSMKQLLNFITYWLIYYFNYWNLKFVIDSFKNFLLPSVQVIENHGMIVISVENVKVNKCFVIIY